MVILMLFDHTQPFNALISSCRFGLGHDGGDERCNNGEYIMASVVSDGKNAFKWSPCSSNRMQEFLT